jgi:hypothetical protein
MSETIQINAEIAEQSPVITIETKLPAVKLSYEERQDIYRQLTKFHDVDHLPLPEEFYDDDPFSERGIVQLQMDAHRVGMLNKGLLKISPELEQLYRDRLNHKIELIRASRSIAVPIYDTSKETA